MWWRRVNPTENPLALYLRKSSSVYLESIWEQKWVGSREMLSVIGDHHRSSLNFSQVPTHLGVRAITWESHWGWSHLTEVEDNRSPLVCESPLHLQQKKNNTYPGEDLHWRDSRVWYSCGQLQMGSCCCQGWRRCSHCSSSGKSSHIDKRISNFL